MNAPAHPDRTLRPALGAGLAAGLLALGAFALLALAAPGDAAIIDNGVVQLGIHHHAALNVPGGTPTAASGTTIVGLRQMSSNYDATSPGCTCEGWGIGYDGAVSGHASTVHGVSGLTVLSASGNSSAYTSVVQVGDLQVTHAFTPSPVTSYLYQVDLKVKNTGAAAHHDIVYRRVADWDVEVTYFHEFVTLAAVSPPPAFVAYSSNHGFASPNPFTFAGSLGSVGPPSGNVIDAGPKDHGMVFDFGLGSLAPGATAELRMFYGVAPSEPDANTALAAVGAQVWSFGQPSTAPITGMPDTFIFAARSMPAACNSASTAGAPGTLTATGAPGPKVDLAWGLAASTCPLTYEVDRSATGATGPFAPIGTTAATTFTDTSVVPCKTYWYRVRALAPAGPGPWSNVASANTPGVPPGAPTGLTATPSGTTVGLAWTPPSSPCAFQQRVEYLAGTTWTAVPPAPLPSTASTHTDSPVAPCTSRTYRVVAFNSLGMAASATATATTGAVAPSAPTGLSAAPTPGAPTTSVSLSWTPPPTSSCPFQQRVEVLTGGTWSTLHAGLPQSAASDTDTPLDPCTARTYRVVAYNGGGDSPPSNVAGTMTAAVPPATPTLTGATHYPPATVSPLGNAGPLNHEAWTPGLGSPCPALAFDLERHEASSGMTTVTSVGLVTSADDQPVQPCDTYTYRVRATTYGGLPGPWSNALSVATWIAAPGAVNDAIAYSKSMATGRVEDGLVGIVDWDVPTANPCPIDQYLIHKTDNTFAPLGVDLYADPHATVAHPTTVLEDAPNLPCVRYTYTIHADNTASGGGIGPGVQVAYTHLVYLDANAYGPSSPDTPLVALPPLCGVPCSPLTFDVWDNTGTFGTLPSAFRVRLDAAPFYEVRDPSTYPAGTGYEVALETQCIPDPPCVSQKGGYVYDNPATGTYLALEESGAPKLVFRQGTPSWGASKLPDEPVGTGHSVVVECVPALPCLWAGAGYTNQVLGFGGWAAAPGTIGAYVHQPTLGGPNPLGTYYAGAALGCIPDVPCVSGGAGRFGVRPLDADVYWPGLDGGTLLLYAYSPSGGTSGGTTTPVKVDPACHVDCQDLPRTTLVDPCQPCPDEPRPGPLPCGICTKVDVPVACSPICVAPKCVCPPDTTVCDPVCLSLQCYCTPDLAICDPCNPDVERCCDSPAACELPPLPRCEDLLQRPCTVPRCDELPQPPLVDPCQPCPPATGPLPCVQCPPAPAAMCRPLPCPDLPGVGRVCECTPSAFLMDCLECAPPIDLDECLPVDPPCSVPIDLDECLPLPCDPTPLANCIPPITVCDGGDIRECLPTVRCITVGRFTFCPDDVTIGNPQELVQEVLDLIRQ